MNYNGLCELMKIEKISYKIFPSLVILIILLSFGCDRPEPAPEVDNASLEENLEEVDLEPKPVTLPIVPPAPIIDKSSRVTILGYHQISDKGSPSEMRISVGKFRSQMQALRDAGVRVISFKDFFKWKRNEKPIPETCVIITVDDGYDDLYDNALPILREFNYPFTFYLYTDFLGGSGRTLNNLEVKELLASGGELGSHSISHDFLVRAKRKFKDEVGYKNWLSKEIKGSKASLEEKFGTTVSSFAYPYGEYSDFLASEVEAAGYNSAVTVNGAKAHFESLIFELPRYIIHGNNDINWKAGTSFGGLGGAVQIEDSTKPSKLPKVWPIPKSEISNRLPMIRVDLSEYPGVKLEEIEMKVTGFGSVPAEFDELTGILKWKTTRRLRVKKHSVYMSFVDPSNGRNKSFSWPFVVNLEAFYLPEYSEKIKLEEESSDQFFLD